MSTSYINVLKKLYEVNKFTKMKLDLKKISKFSQVCHFLIIKIGKLKLEKD